ncbi:MAG: gliding motility protein GldN [Flavobacteriales bacterium]|nr:gliding motility protein GldN [Flavobacteriales bacterium]|tara:strand:- start:15018 stop:15866 length:849 start_codon:yes stop_codon:yes gene_type:complete
MKSIKLVAILMLAGVFCSNFAQAQQEVLDGIYVREHHPAKRVIPYTPLREADVMWLKRIWRVLDLREKINHPLYYPTEKIMDRQSMTQLIYESVINPDALVTITPYDVLDDEFTVRLTVAEVEQKTTKVDTEFVEDEFGDLKPLPIKEEFAPHAVKRYRMKEEWFFDNQKSVLEPRIIGMCPVQEKFDEMGEYKGEMPLFWIYFPEARLAFSTVPVYNPSNDAERRTLEDIFWKRKFSSYIYKESNVYDRKIDTYKASLDLLLESKRIEHVIFEFEQDLWEY